MPLPLPSLTFYKMPRVYIATGDFWGALTALFNSGSSLVDYKGTTVPATHRWNFFNDGANSVRATAPAGTPMGFTPALLWASSAAGMGSATFVGLDAYTASNHYHGISKSPGAFSSFNVANPFSSGNYSGYIRWAGTTINTTAGFAQVYLSQESVYAEIQTGAATDCAFRTYSGAILEPYTDSSGVTCETDSRLYGMVCTSAVNTNGKNFQDVSNNFLDYTSTNGVAKAACFNPGLSSVTPAAREALMQASANVQGRDFVGTYVLRRVGFVVVPSQQNGSALGTLRGLSYFNENIVAGVPVRSGGVDFFHPVGSVAPFGVGPQMLLPAA